MNGTEIIHLFKNVTTILYEKHYPIISTTIQLVSKNITSCLVEYFKEVELNIKNVVETIWYQQLFDANISQHLQFLSEIHLLQSLILLDGSICACYFLKDFLLLKLYEKKVQRTPNIIFQEKSNLISRYNKLYHLNSFDRYLFYMCVYLSYKSVCLFDVFESTHLLSVCMFLSIPFIQNKIFKTFNKQVQNYQENKYIFIKYYVSKLIVYGLQSLHKDIDEIKNFQIFLIYEVLSFNFAYCCLRNYIFVCLLYFLKNRGSNLYYYYKAIKAAYLWNTGYNFEPQSLYDSVYLANLVIKESRWSEFSKMEIVNMLYILIRNKISDPTTSLYVTTSINLIKVMSLWSLVSIAKLCVLYFNTTSLTCIFLALILLLVFYKIKNKVQKVSIGVICCGMLMCNANDLVVTTILVSNGPVCNVLCELYFFGKNINNIKKIVRPTTINKNQINVSEMEKDFFFVNG